MHICVCCVILGTINILKIFARLFFVITSYIIKFLVFYIFRCSPVLTELCVCMCEMLKFSVKCCCSMFTDEDLDTVLLLLCSSSTVP